MGRFAADSCVGLDVAHFTRNAPGKAADANGRARWLDRAPPMAVFGCEMDAVVDAEGVRETANFLGVTPTMLSSMPHDLMLCTGWEEAADALLGWVDGVTSVDHAQADA